MSNKDYPGITPGLSAIIRAQTDTLTVYTSHLIWVIVYVPYLLFLSEPRTMLWVGK